MYQLLDKYMSIGIGYFEMKASANFYIIDYAVTFISKYTSKAENLPVLLSSCFFNHVKNYTAVHSENVIGITDM
jgi:hypothetical protein